MSNNADDQPALPVAVEDEMELEEDEEDGMEMENRVVGEDGMGEDDREEGAGEDDEMGSVQLGSVNETQGSRTSSQWSRDLNGEEVEDPNEPPEQRMTRLFYQVFDGVLGNDTYDQQEIDLIKQQWGEECAICMEGPPMRSPAIFPDCVHIFCGQCAVEQVRRFGQCPLCGDESGAEVWNLRLLDMQID